MINGAKGVKNRVLYNPKTHSDLQDEYAFFGGKKQGFRLFLPWPDLAVGVDHFLFAVFDLALEVVHGHINALVQIFAVFFRSQRFLSEPEI